MGYSRRLLPYQNHIDLGRFVIRVFENNGERGEQMLVTGKGEIWIAKLIREHEKTPSATAPHLKLIDQNNQ